MKSKIIISILLGLLLMTSCEGFLEEKIYSQITPESLFISGDNAQLAVNAIYAEYFDDWNCYRAIVFAHGMSCNQEMTFEAQNDNCDLKWTAGLAGNLTIWQGLYQGINAANNAIEGITGMTVTSSFTEAKKNQLIAEARFLRAHGYYHLLRYWGGVPIHDKPTGNPENSVKPRNTPQEVFSFIVADLKAAQQYLPVSYTGKFPDNGQATLGAATATLAMVYAQVSGVQFQGLIDKKYWAEAKAELVKLINISDVKNAMAPYKYSLEPDFKDLFWGGKAVGINYEPVRTANDLGREIIWCANYDPLAFANHGTWYFNHWERGISNYVLGKFQQGDYRTVISLDKESYKAQGLTVSAKIKRTRTGNDNHNNVYFARYGAMLLLLAEVENEINNGPTALALSCINAIRARARAGLNGAENNPVPADIPTGLNYAQFKDKVFDERAVELLLEWHFWDDLERSGRLERDYAALGSGVKGNRGTYDAKWKFWPIPLNEIVSSGGIIKQNPGH